MGEFLLGGVLFFVHYNGKCWYFYVLEVGNFELDLTSHHWYSSTCYEQYEART